MSQETWQEQVVVSNPQGLHARPAHQFVSLASQFSAQVQVSRDGEQVDGKSILSVLTLGAEQGVELSIRATGRDARQAVSALVELVRKGFADAQTGNGVAD